MAVRVTSKKIANKTDFTVAHDGSGLIILVRQKRGGNIGPIYKYRMTLGYIYIYIYIHRHILLANDIMIETWYQHFEM